MTYVDLYHKACDAFDPEHKGTIKGGPVEVLYKISRLADAQTWEHEVDRNELRHWLSADYLDARSAATVLAII